MTNDTQNEEKKPPITIDAPYPAVDLMKWHDLVYALTARRRVVPEGTLKAYLSDLRQFAGFCADTGQTALPAEAPAIVSHLKACKKNKLKLATCRRRVSAIRYVHLLVDLEDPTKDERVILELLPTVGSTPEEKKNLAEEAPMQKLPVRLTKTGVSTAVLLEDLLEACDETTVRGLRDKMLMSVGFDTGLRGSELVSLMTNQLELYPDGGSVEVNYVKRGKKGRVTRRALSRPSVELIREWFSLVGEQEGVLFKSITKHGTIRDRGLSCDMVSRIMKRLALEAGYSKKMIAGVASHSFRIGQAQELYVDGHSPAAIMMALGWRSLDSLMEYLREIDVRQNASAQLLSSRRA